MNTAPRHHWSNWLVTALLPASITAHFGMTTQQVSTRSIAPVAVTPTADELRQIQSIIAMRPNWAPAHFALSQALERRGDLAAALAGYELVLEIKPHCVDALQALAALFLKLGRLSDARRQYEQAVALAPANHEIRTNLGVVLQELGETDAAVACYQRALTIAPECLEAHVNLAAARLKLRQYSAAVVGLEEAAAIYPESTEIQNRLGHALVPLGRLDEAREHYSTAIRLEPRRDLWRLRRDLLTPAVFSSNREIDDHQQALAERLACYCGERLRFEVDELPGSNCHPPPELIYHGRDDLALRRSLAEVFERSMPSTALPAVASGVPRLAFIVTKGSEGIFLRGMAGVLSRLSTDRFRTTVVCAPSGLSRFKAVLGEGRIDYLTFSPSLTETLASIHSQQFDLAYFWEVGTDSLSYFLPFFRLAGVQCASWGWPVTSGMAAMDYFLSSELLEPPNGDAHYCERLLRLKHISNFYPRPTAPPPAADRKRFDLSEDQHVYLCAQNPAKIQPDFDALAGEILRRDPRGMLLLVEARWPHVNEAIRRRFAARYPDCADRCKFVPRMVQLDYLKLLATADVALDTVHYCGGANSVYDALAVGTPVVTLPGNLHRGRYTLAAYRTMGMAACIANSAAEYVESALRLASDLDHRRMISNEIAASRGALFDNVAAVRELEDVFEQLAIDGRKSRA